MPRFAKPTLTAGYFTPYHLTAPFLSYTSQPCHPFLRPKHLLGYVLALINLSGRTLGRVLEHFPAGLCWR